MIQRIGVWNTAFLGDAVLTLPLVQTLAAAFPDAELDFYVRRGFGALFEAQPQIRTVYEYDKRRSAGSSLAALWTFGRTLAARQYDLWIGAHPSSRSALLARLSGAPVRIGYSGGLVQRLCYTRTVSRRFSELHEIERLLELIRPVLPASVPPQHWPELVLPAASVARALAFREKLRCAAPLPVSAAGAAVAVSAPIPALAPASASAP
ncbi:MAG: glycosyltransferase family 9 protein, partial [Bilophila sp.]